MDRREGSMAVANIVMKKGEFVAKHRQTKRWKENRILRSPGRQKKWKEERLLLSLGNGAMTRERNDTSLCRENGVER